VWGFSPDLIPVIPRGTRADILGACLEKSAIWSHVKVFNLRTNMRAMLTSKSSDINFAFLLLDVGNGNVQSEDNYIKLSDELGTQIYTLNYLTNNVYPHIKKLLSKNIELLCERAIITHTNSVADEIYLQFLDKYQFECKIFHSIDTVVNYYDNVHYPQEFLNRLNSIGIPSHQLVLKIGAPIILLSKFRSSKAL